ncbi:MAG: 4Fe-4S binding protein [Kiritimatiellia bacterium]|jgi:ferredoxin
MKKAPRRIRIAAALAVFALVALGFAGKLPLPPQLGPAILRVAATGAATAAAVVAVFVLLTLLFGRFYCAALCPLGILQDFIGWASRRKGKRAPRKNLKTLRYTLLAATAGLIAAGWTLPAKLLEPFSVFGRFHAGFAMPVFAKFVRKHGIRVIDGDCAATAAGIAVGAGVLVVLILLVVWKRRLYCTSICPVGSLLGLFAKVGVFHMDIDESCIHCGKCAAVCPAGCIDPKAGTLDNERCLRCMNCVAVCPRQAVTWSRRRVADKAASRRPAEAPAREPRRRFLAGMAGTVLASFGLGRVFKPSGMARRPPQPAIYPPGAGSAARFESKCTACLLCVANCRGNVLRAPDAKNHSVHLDYKNGMCEFNCNTCSTICPTGAIRPLSLEKKKRCRIGMAVLHKSRCVAIVDGIHCGACAEHCPTGALRMVQHAGAPCPVPELNEALCIGCGNCSYPCPVKPVPAMTIAPVPIQTEADDPSRHFDKPPAQAKPREDDAWLI